jgi:hypothetical protein
MNDCGRQHFRGDFRGRLLPQQFKVFADLLRTNNMGAFRHGRNPANGNFRSDKLMQYLQMQLDSNPESNRELQQQHCKHLQRHE